jgi:hypothetical protein
MRFTFRFGVVIALGPWTGSVALSTELSVIVPADRDNTLYESATGALSNGSGEHFFVGRTAQPPPDSIRRGLIWFDIVGIVPPGSTITGASLTLHCSWAIAGERDVELRRVLADWGEGASDAAGAEGSGAPAAPGDATWLHTFSQTDFWNGAGGDFSMTPSAITAVDLYDAYYSWSGTSQMIADVQDWLDNPVGNFGWLLLGDESTASTAKRFDTHENLTPEFRPALTVEYTLAPLPGDASCDGEVDEEDIPLFVEALVDPLNYSGCDITRADANEDGDLDGRDVRALLGILLP